MGYKIENGPCPLVAICNVLFLRGDLDIQPPDREVVKFEYLVERLGDYLLNHVSQEEVLKKANLFLFFHNYAICFLSFLLLHLNSGNTS